MTRSAASICTAFRLKITEPAYGFGHFPADRPVDYFEQLLSEALVTSYARGVPVREWRRKKGVRREALDARVYSFAALQALLSMGLSLDRECERTDVQAANAVSQEPPRVSCSRWMKS